MGFEGSWCAACKIDWFMMNDKCYECPENSLPMVLAAVALFVVISAFIVSIATSKPKSGSIMKEVAATPMSIIFTRVQISLPVFQLGMAWPQWLLDLQVRCARAAPTCCDALQQLSVAVRRQNMLKGLISLDISAMT